MNKTGKSADPLISERLKQFREHLGFSKGQMARRLDVAVGSYAKYEARLRSPSFIVLSRLVKDFGLSVNWLYFNKGPMILEDENSREPGYKEIFRQRDTLRAQVEELSSRLQVKENQDQLAGQPKMSPEIKDLVEQMGKIPLLNYEILAQYHRFKNKEKE